jgi:TetR/AcrR family transcriptional regulator, transcriptional repressor for nem operon
VFKALVSVLERSLAQNGRRRCTTAQAIAALSIGGMVVARTMIDRALADKLRAACIAVALDLGGWDKESKSADGKSKRPRSRRVAAS